jgi:hypothetical protein
MAFPEQIDITPAASGGFPKHIRLAADGNPAFKDSHLFTGYSEDVEKLSEKGLGVGFLPCFRGRVLPLGAKGGGSYSYLVP